MSSHVDVYPWAIGWPRALGRPILSMRPPRAARLVPPTSRRGKTASPRLRSRCRRRPESSGRRCAIGWADGCCVRQRRIGDAAAPVRSEAVLLARLTSLRSARSDQPAPATVSLPGCERQVRCFRAYQSPWFRYFGASARVHGALVLEQTAARTVPDSACCNRRKHGVTARGSRPYDRRRHEHARRLQSASNRLGSVQPRGARRSAEARLRRGA